MAIDSAILQIKETLRSRRFEEALVLSEQAIAEHGEVPVLVYFKGLSLVSLDPPLEGSMDQGVQFLRLAAVLAPSTVEYHYNLAVALAKSKAAEQAILHLRHVLRREPEHVAALDFLIGLLMHVGRIAEAEQKLDRIAAAVGDRHRFLARYGRRVAGVRAARGDYAAAREVIASLPPPEKPNERFQLASVCLAMQDFKTGWAAYRDRGNRQTELARLPFPIWNGEALHGKTILVRGEQGLGDEIMFFSIAGDLLPEADTVILACRAPLVELLSAAFPTAKVVASSSLDYEAGAADLGAVDYQCLVGDLAQYRRGTVESFTDKGNYLAVPVEERDSARRVLQALAPRFEQSFNVGLVWATGSSNDPDARYFAEKKSIPPSILESLDGLERVQFFSLQNVNHAEQAARIPSVDVVDLAHHMPEFIDTAAFLSNLSLLITVDTAQAHLAGALGIPCCILLPEDADWRWGAEGERSYWYPSVRLFRWDRERGWPGAVARARDELIALMKEQPARDA